MSMRMEKYRFNRNYSIDYSFFNLFYYFSDFTGFMGFNYFMIYYYRYEDDDDDFSDDDDEPQIPDYVDEKGKCKYCKRDFQQ